MGRPREFEIERAVDGAIEAFRAGGYEATSTRDLCTATGLGRSSIYNTFHSKDALFRMALTRYAERMTERQIEVMAEPRPLREKIRWLFRAVLDDEFAPEGRRPSCLVWNTSADPTTHDAQVVALLRRDRERRVGALRDAIASARRGGEIGPDGEPDDETAAQLVTVAGGGIRLAAREGVPRAALESVVTTTLRAVLGTPDEAAP